MKANEYVNLYYEKIINGDSNAVQTMVLSLSDEVIDICNRRNVKRLDAQVGAIREVNDKYNAIVRIVNSRYGSPIMKQDGFINFWCRRIPELERFMRNGR